MIGIDLPTYQKIYTKVGCTVVTFCTFAVLYCMYTTVQLNIVLLHYSRLYCTPLNCTEQCRTEPCYTVLYCNIMHYSSHHINMKTIQDCHESASRQSSSPSLQYRRKT